MNSPDTEDREGAGGLVNTPDVEDGEGAGGPVNSPDVEDREGNGGPGGVMDAPSSASRRWVRDTFHGIARRYDLLNHLLSGGVHLLWKRAAVRAAGLRPGGVGLDVCCGTGDMVALMARDVGPRGRAVGMDFAPGMLAVAGERLARSRRSLEGSHGHMAGPRRGRVTGRERAAGLRQGLPESRRHAGVGLACADAEALPAVDASVDAVTFAFGLRNVARPEQALLEAHRVLRPGGRLVILEFGQPRSRLLRAAYDLYSRTVVPRLGGWLSGRRDAYQYLHDSIRQWVDPESLAGIMRDSGFEQVGYRLLTGGIAVLHVGVKPSR